jgi:uncharacterized membrane protein
MNTPLITWICVVAIMLLLMLTQLVRYNLKFLRKKSTATGNAHKH